MRAGYMPRATTADYQAVRHELGRRLRALRDDCRPMETARVLLSYDGPGQRLVGLRHDGERAVYFQAATREAIAVYVDVDGLDRRGGRPIATLSARGSVGGWAERMRYYWAWRHPRYRRDGAGLEPGGTVRCDSRTR